MDNFVRIWVDHIARTLPTPEAKVHWLKISNEAIAPFVADSDEAGHLFRSEGGHPFRREAGRSFRDEAGQDSDRMSDAGAAPCGSLGMNSGRTGGRQAAASAPSIAP